MNKSTQLILCFSLFLSIVDQPLGAQTLEKTNPDILFKENKGQVYDQNSKPRPDILYYGHTGQFNFHLKKNGISYQLERVEEWKTETPSYLSPICRKERTEPSLINLYRLDIDWLNTNTNAEIVQGPATSGEENYYNESAPHGALHVKNYESLLYKNIYQGIDLKWLGTEKGLKYEYYVAAGSNYKNIQFQYAGAEKIYLSPKGELIIKTPLGEIVEQKPYVTQNNKKVEANWSLKGDIISFDIRNFDSQLPLIIDPLVRFWGTYYGGPGIDYLYTLAIDNTGNTYFGGEVKSSANMATSGAYQTTYGGTNGNWGDAFVCKFDPAGVLQWGTYYGGSQSEFANGVAVDGSGNVYLVGGTSSTNSAVIATAGAHQSVAASSTITAPVNDAFLVKFNSSGVRQWGTYYGGTAYEWAYGVAVNTAGEIVMTGTTRSTNSISTVGTHQQTNAGGTTDGFIVKFDAGGTRLWGTYYGGSNGAQDDVLFSSFDSNGDIIVNGSTSATTGISTSGAHQATYGGGSIDGFLARFTANGQRLWGTYYGGTGTDHFSINVLDANGNIYLTGTTSTSLTGIIATALSHQPAYGGNSDAMFVKFNSSGVRQWGTYYGGSGGEYGANPSIDLLGNIYISGGTSTSSGTAIATSCAYQETFKGGSGDAFLAKFDASGSRIWGTYFGSIYSDDGGMCVADNHANVYLSGVTLANSGTVMVTSGAHQTTFGGQSDTFIEKFNGCIPGNAIDMTPASHLLVCPGNTTTLSATCGNWYSSPTGTNSLATGSTFTTGILNSDTTFYVEDFSCGSIFGPRTAISLTLIPSPTITISNSNPTACIQEFVTLTANGASTYSWMNTSSATSTHTFFTLLNTTFTVLGTAANGCQSTATIAIAPVFCLGTDKLSYLNAQLTIFPNPGDIVTVHGETELELLLVNQLGQAVRSLRLSSENGYELILSDLPNGIYFLKDTEDGSMLNKKIVIMR